MASEAVPLTLPSCTRTHTRTRPAPMPESAREAVTRRHEAGPGACPIPRGAGDSPRPPAAPRADSAGLRLCIPETPSPVGAEGRRVVNHCSFIFPLSPHCRCPSEQPSSQSALSIWQCLRPPPRIQPPPSRAGQPGWPSPAPASRVGAGLRVTSHSGPGPSGRSRVGGRAGGGAAAGT